MHGHVTLYVLPWFIVTGMQYLLSVVKCERLQTQIWDFSVHSIKTEMRKRIANPQSKKILKQAMRNRIVKPASKPSGSKEIPKRIVKPATKRTGQNPLVAQKILNEVRKIYDQQTDGRHKLYKLNILDVVSDCGQCLLVIFIFVWVELSLCWVRSVSWMG